MTSVGTVTVDKKIGAWLINGETGLSSKAMAAVALDVGSDGSHPYDPDDLNRCLKLIDKIPEIKQHFDEIAQLSNTWRLMIAKWDELESLFISEVGFDWSKGDSAPKTYELMREIREAGSIHG